MNDTRSHGVVLPEGHTGSSYFHKVLSEAAAKFPEALAAVELPPTASRFKATYGEALLRFELARLQSEERVEIARFIAQTTQAGLSFQNGEGRVPLGPYLSERVRAPEFRELRFDAEPGLVPEVPFAGKTYRGEDLIELAQLLRTRHYVTEGVVAALTWLVGHSKQTGGKLQLNGRKFALMGAGAELAPTALLQRAGATVLWIDILDPRDKLSERQDLAGCLLYAPDHSNLLAQPREVAAAIARFAEGDPVDIGMFAYAAGASQEWRLGASMNAIVRSLEPSDVKSVAMFVSPTTVARVYPADIRDARQRMASRPTWQKIMQGMQGLHTPGQLGEGDLQVAKAVVGVQGVSYQAAQYISKLIAAETYAVYGTDLAAETPRPITVSANIAGITRTRSLSHPVFQAAFVGAPSFGVQIFDPETTRALNGLLVLHDVLNPEAPGAAGRTYATHRGHADALLSQQVHGGIYSMPFALDSAIRIAALLGMARKPTVLIK